MKSAMTCSLLAAFAAALVGGCGTTQPKTAEPSPQPKPAPTAKEAPTTETVVDGQRFSTDILVVLGNVPDTPGDLWTNKVAATSKPAPKPPAKPAPQADTSKYKDTTDDGKGKLTASGEGFSGEGFANAIDNKNSKWCIEAKSTWLQYEYAAGAKHKVTAYTIMSANDGPGRDPKNWKLLGSNDGKSWIEVDSRKDEDFGARFEKRLFKVKTPGEYNAYRLEVAENHGDVSSQYAELELLVDK